MAWTSPTTRSTGDLITAAIWNTDLVDNLDETGPAKVTTKGDILAASAANTLGRLAVGTNDQQLVADSAQSLGIKWSDSIGIWAPLSTFSNTNTGDVVSFDTGTITTYDVYMVVGVLANHEASLVNSVACRVNNISSANYARVEIRSATINYSTGGANWVLCHMYNNAAGTNTVAFTYYVRGGNLASSPGLRYPTIHGSSSSYMAAAYGSTSNGELRVDTATVNRILVFTTTNATGAMKVFGLNL